MPKSRTYLDMLTHGMVLNGVLEVLEAARVHDYDPDQAIEELAFGLAVLCQMTHVPIEDGMRSLQRCIDVQDATHHFIRSRDTAEA